MAINYGLKMAPAAIRSLSDFSNNVLRRLDPCYLQSRAHGSRSRACGWWN